MTIRACSSSLSRRNSAGSIPSGGIHSNDSASATRETWSMTFVLGCAGGIAEPASVVNRRGEGVKLAVVVRLECDDLPADGDAADDAGDVGRLEAGALSGRQRGMVEQGEPLDLGRLGVVGVDRRGSLLEDVFLARRVFKRPSRSRSGQMSWTSSTRSSGPGGAINWQRASRSTASVVVPSFLMARRRA